MGVCGVIVGLLRFVPPLRTHPQRGFPGVQGFERLGQATINHKQSAGRVLVHNGERKVCVVKGVM